MALNDGHLLDDPVGGFATARRGGRVRPELTPPTAPRATVRPNPGVTPTPGACSLAILMHRAFCG